MNTQQAYIEGFTKRASEYGLSQNEAFELLKSAVSLDDIEKYEKAKMNPAVATLVSTGLLPTLAYGTYKDVTNSHYNPYAREAADIDPGKIFSGARMKHVNEHSGTSLLLTEQLKNMLKGIGIGGLTGAAVGGISHAMGLNGDNSSLADSVRHGAGFGAVPGFVGGTLYGGYSAANKYNDVIKQRMRENSEKE